MFTSEIPKFVGITYREGRSKGVQMGCICPSGGLEEALNIHHPNSNASMAKLTTTTTSTTSHTTTTTLILF